MKFTGWQPVLEELLYSALEDTSSTFIIGQGPSARTHTLEVEAFTFVGATTRAGLISAPLRSRFGSCCGWSFNAGGSAGDRGAIGGKFWGCRLTMRARLRLPSRSRGTPRIANRLWRRVRDYAQVRGAGKIDLPTAQAALQMLGSGSIRLRRSRSKAAADDYRKVSGRAGGVEYAGGGAGRRTGCDRRIYEPFLMQIGFLNRTPRGQWRRNWAYEHFGITPSRRQSSCSESSLFYNVY